MTYEDAVSFLLESVSPGSILGLEVMERLLLELQNPHLGLNYIHVAGTNGKGSVCINVSSILKHAGYKTGLFVSPAVESFDAQIQINSLAIPQESLCELTQLLVHPCERIEASGLRRPTSFELVCALMFLYFKREKTDFVVLETGLGGIGDATNVIPCPLVSVITGIGLDHTTVLGSTIAEIAEKKAGIIKGGKTVLYPQDNQAEGVIVRACNKTHSELVRVDSESIKVTAMSESGLGFDYNGFSGLSTPLIGFHQALNVATAIETVLAVREYGFLVGDDAVRNGLSAVKWPGRFEILNREPVVIADGAHNPHAASALTETLRQLYPERKISFITGVLADKDYTSLIRITEPIASGYRTVTPPSERALDAEMLKDAVEKLTKVPVTAFRDINTALCDAIAHAAANEIICVFGTLSQIHITREYFNTK